MTEENLSESVRKYYIFRYAVIGLVLLSSVLFMGTNLGFRGEPETSPPEILTTEDTRYVESKTPPLETTLPEELGYTESETAALETVTTAPTTETVFAKQTPPPEAAITEETHANEEDAASGQAIVSSPRGMGSIGIFTGGLLLVVGLVYVVHMRRSVPGFIRGYVEEQTPFWHITREAQDFTIQMNGTSILIRFSPKTRNRWGALRIELPLSMRFPGEQVRRICEQNGVRFSEEDNIISTIAAPEELNWKLLVFFRIVRQINALKE